MASGSFKVNSAVSYMWVKVNWSSTTNIGANKSRVKMDVYIEKNGGSPWNGYSPTLSMSINGSNGSRATGFDLRSRNSQWIGSYETDVGHSSDGTKTCRISMYYPTGTTGGNIGGYANVKLDTIPRASSMSISKSSMNYGDSVTFSISRASSSFQHIINGNWGAGSKNMMSKRSDTSFTWTLPNSYMNNIPNSTSKKATIWLDTYSGDTKIGTKTYYITGNVPSSVVPTVGSTTAYDENATSRNLMNASNQFIQGVSDIRIDNNGGAGTYSSTISQRQFVLPNGQTVTISSGWQYSAGITNVTGTKTIRSRIKDSRGRWSAWKNVSVTIYAYSAPQLNSFSIARLSAGTTLQIKAKGSISSLNGKNSYNLWVDTSDKGKNSWTNRYNYKTGTSFDVTANISGSYDIAKSYDIRVNLTDRLGNTQRLTSIGTIKKILTVRRNIGIGIGKIHEQGALDVGGDLYMNGNVIRGAKADVSSTAIPQSWFDSRFTHYNSDNQQVYYWESGGVGHLQGFMKPTVVIPANTDEGKDMAITLPSGKRPKFTVSSLNAGTNTRNYVLVAYPDGRVTVSRYRAGDIGAADIGSGDWLNVNISFPLA